MTTIYQRSLMDLRRIESALNNELAGVDLAALKNSSSVSPMDNDTAMQWRDILAVLAVPLVDLGRSVRSADAYLVQEYKSNKMLCRVITFLQGVIIVVVFVTIAKNYVADLITKDVVWTSVKAGTVVCMVIVVLTVLGVWRQGLIESARRVEFDKASPISLYFHRFQSRLCNQPPVQLMAVLISGRDPLQVVVDEANLGIGRVPSPCKQNYSNLAARKINDACSMSANGQMTLEGMATFLATYPAGMMQDMAAALLELRSSGGVDALDHPTMWRCVDLGLESVKQLVLKAYDPVQGSGDIEQTIRKEIVPLLKIDGAMLRNAYVSNGSTLPWRKVTNIDGKPMDRATCFAMCQASPESRLAYFQPSSIGKDGKCYMSTGEANDINALSASSAFVGVGAGQDSLMARQQEGSSRLDLYDKAVGEKGKGTGIADLIRTTSSQIASSIVQVLRRTQFRFDIMDPRYKDIIDSELLKHYGPPAYDASVRSAIDDVFVQVRSQVLQMSLPAAREIDLTFVTPQRFLDKVAAMSETELLEVQRSLNKLAQCTRDHGKMYPVYTSVMPKNVVSRVSFGSNVVVFVGFGIVLLVLYTKGTAEDKDGHVALKMEDMVRFAAYGLCGISILLITLETLMRKSMVRREHNSDEMTKNGETLVAATDRMTAQFEVVMRAVGRGADGASGTAVDPMRARSMALSGLALTADNRYKAQTAAAAFIAQARLAFDKYAECNSIANGQPKLPMPIAETLLYSVIGIGFAVVTAYVVGAIAPSQRIQSLRMLYDLKTRVGRGDPDAVVGAQALLACSMPGSMMWTILTWFWVATMIMVTVWFLMVSLNVVSDYTRTLEATSGCE